MCSAILMVNTFRKKLEPIQSVVPLPLHLGEKQPREMEVLGLEGHDLGPALFLHSH